MKPYRAVKDVIVKNGKMLILKRSNEEDVSRGNGIFQAGNRYNESVEQALKKGNNGRARYKCGNDKENTNMEVLQRAEKHRWYYNAV